MASTHNLVGHLGYKKTYDHLANQFIWPNMTKDVQEYIKTCNSCQRNKESTQLPARLLHQPDMPVMSGTHFSMDFIGPLPPSQWNGIWYDSIFVYKNCLMDGLKHGQQVLMLLEKISQTYTTLTYSH